MIDNIVIPQPNTTAADGYIGLAIIYGAMSLFWFVGIQGPSIVEPLLHNHLLKLLLHIFVYHRP